MATRVKGRSTSRVGSRKQFKKGGYVYRATFQKLKLVKSKKK